MYGMQSELQLMRIDCRLQARGTGIKTLQRGTQCKMGFIALITSSALAPRALQCNAKTRCHFSRAYPIHSSRTGESASDRSKLEQISLYNSR